MADLWRDFWIREIGTGQQVAQIHDRYMMMMMKNASIVSIWNRKGKEEFKFQYLTSTKYYRQVSLYAKETFVKNVAQVEHKIST